MPQERPGQDFEHRGIVVSKEDAGHDDRLSQWRGFITPLDRMILPLEQLGRYSKLTPGGLRWLPCEQRR